MSVYERSVRVNAPLESVWSFHSDVSGLEALTPSFMHLEVVEVRGPDGGLDPGVLDAGSEIDMEMRPLGVLPSQSWTSVVRERTEETDSASFVDEMVGGPFREWTHTHSFFADGDATTVRDRVEYELPFGAVGEVLGPLGVVGFEPMFRYRHRRTKQLLE